MLIEIELEDSLQGHELQVKLTVAHVLACLLHNTLPMALLDGIVLQLFDLGDRHGKAVNCFLQLDERVDLIGLLKLLLAELLNLF